MVTVKIIEDGKIIKAYINTGAARGPKGDPGDGSTMTAAEIKDLYESNPDTNAFTDAEKASLANQSGINTGDQDLSSYATFGYVDSELLDKVDKIIGKGLSTEDYTSGEKTKLNGIAENATANDTDANLKNRSNHTGTQLASTISDFASGVLNVVLAGLSIVTGTAVTSADSVLSAFGKLQGQINDILTSLNLKAPLASPTFTGTPTAPLAATGNNTTQLATTEFVQQELNANTVYFDATQISGSGTSGDPYTLKNSRQRWALAADFSTASLSFVDIGLTSGTLAVGTYDFEVILYTSSTSASGIQCQIATTGTMSGNYLTCARTTGPTAISHGYNVAFNVFAGGTFNTVVGTAYLTYRGTIVVAVAGTVSIQGRAVAGTSTFLTHSRLVITKV